MSNRVKGVGINLRLDYINQFLELRPKVDFVEVILDNYHSLGPHHKKLEKVRSDYDVSFHCTGMNLGGVDELNLEYLNKTRELIRIFSPFHVSDHLCFGKLNGVAFHDLLPFPLNNEFLKNVTARVHKVQEVLDKQILVENLSYYTEYESSHMSEVDFLNELSFKTDSKILLDINNIWVNELNLSIDSREFLKTIDWSRVGEIHLAGAEKFGDVYIDTHGSDVSQEVLELTRENKDKIKDIPVVYERDTNLPPFGEIIDQRNRIEEIIYER
jgi:uncharacterized protein (UPF0276 family)